MRSSGSPAPAVSVVIASYRWPEALRLSLASALAQTVRDLEVLVVEDGRDRDSRDVVRAAGDGRARWLHRRVDTGDQAGPNALGWRRARAPVVAYLAQDDLWERDHLEWLLAALSSGADLAHSVAIAFGPPPQDWVRLAGTAPWEPNVSVPASSIAHLRESPRLGAWPPPTRSRWPSDYGFLIAARERGAVIATSGHATAFTFPASWRPDVYRSRDVAQQSQLSGRLSSEPLLGESLLARALAGGAGTLPAPPEAPPGELVDHRRRLQGLRARSGAWRTRWTADDPLEFPGWYPTEVDEQGRAYRWTGPTERAFVRLDVPLAAHVSVRIALVNWIDAQQLAGVQVDVNGVALEAEQTWDDDGMLAIAAYAGDNPGRATVEVGVSAPMVTVRDDRDPDEPGERPVGVAVREIRVLLSRTPGIHTAIRTGTRTGGRRRRGLRRARS